MDKNEQEKYWHTSSHILAHAVQRLFPDIKLGTGPAIEKGFYYDFYRKNPFTPEDLKLIEKAMSSIIKENLSVEPVKKNKEEARAILKDEPFKLEILEALEGEQAIFYKQGNFIDLCQGPHLSSTGQVKHFKLLSVAASYWRGDEKRESMQRIYGISFPEKQELEEYLKFIEEAKERDHRTLGTKLDLFSMHPEFGSGLIYWHPKGSIIRKLVEDFWKEIHLKNGYELVYTPHIADIALWDKSGHTGFYKENMFAPMVTEAKTFQLKPMNCPFHILIYNNRLRSYRELPIRWAELGTVYRYEKQGVLHGLLRVRGFTQDDAHIFCTEEQAEEEVIKVLDLVCFFLKKFGFADYRICLSTRPEKFVGTPENWQKATTALENALKGRNMNYEIDPGEGVFYGPKIDIKVKDCLNREWQCSTIQVDFNIPERFDVKYTGNEGDFKTPILIHRAIFGSIERFLGILIEHYKGSFPFWLAPEQLRILPISDRHMPYAEKTAKDIEPHFRVQVDRRNEKINRKIRDAEEEKVPYMLILGDKEEAGGTLSLRKHKTGMVGTFSAEKLIKMLREESGQP
ncbi:MAG: threonine--tRNA ligase [Candidatus Omnitrophica bacterium]|nr:threonine--tRNA ligase [Candidatus Omnitrophota bacterium]